MKIVLLSLHLINEYSYYLMLHLIFWGEGEARATFRSSCVWPWLMTLRFGRFPIDLRIFQLVVYSKIDPNRCKSISIDRNVSYDTLLDAASKTMLIVSSENSKNRSKSNILTEFEWRSNENRWKFMKIDRNRSKRQLRCTSRHSLSATSIVSERMIMTDHY